MWTLILYIYAGVFANGDSVTLTNIPSFTTEQACIDAGEKAKQELTEGSTKVARYVCVNQQN